MIQASTFVSALPLAAKYAEMGKILVAKPNSLLSELVTLSSSPFTFPVETQEALINYGNYLEHATESTLENPSAHSVAADVNITELSKIVASHISFAKNTVKPSVMEFADKYIAYLSAMKLRDVNLDFNIEVLSLPEVLKDESFLDNLVYYKDKTVILPKLSFALGTKNDEQLKSLVSVGSTRIDNLINQWLIDLKPDFLQNVYNSFFTKTNTAGTFDFDKLNNNDVFTKTNITLAIYLIARKLYLEVDESASDMNLASYKETAVQIRDYAGSSLASNLVKIWALIKNNTLVIESNYNTHYAKVCGDVYKPWIKSGGKPEIILGMIVSNKFISQQSLIDEKALKFEQEWNSYVTFANIAETNKRFEYIKQYLVTEFNLTLQSLSEAEKTISSSSPKYITTINELVQKEVDNFKHNNIEDAYEVALHLVAKCRFYYTSAFDILHGINHAAKVNPNIDVREAALLSCINYVSDYLADQIAVAGNV